MKKLWLSVTLVLLLITCACQRKKKPTPTETLPAATGATSQLWALTRGGPKSDQAWGVDVDPQGNVYLAAYEQKPGDLFTDIAVYKFSASGQQLWRINWGGKYEDKAFIVKADGDTVYVGGLTQLSANPADAQMVVLALDASDGRQQWQFTWGQGVGYQEVDGLTADGNAIYVSGWTTSAKTGNDLALLKLDRQGHLLWKSIWGTPAFDEADGHMVVDDNFIYLSGRIDATNILLGGDALIAKFSKQTGQYISHVTWGGAFFDDALGLTSDGNALYAVGLTSSKGNNGQIFVLKLDKELHILWEQVWGGAQGEAARAIAVGPDGNLYVAGKTESYGAGKNDIVLLSFDPQGKLRWYRTWGGPQDDSSHDLVIDGDFIYIAGETNSFGQGQNDDLLLKVNRVTGQFPPTP